MPIVLSRPHKRKFGLPAMLFLIATTGIAAVALSSAASAGPAPQTKGTLQIYFIDVEGGQSTLFVTPEGQSLLIDTGWDGYGGRDADRIVAAAKMAGLKKIDYVLITHYHEDHVGGATQLAARIPIGTFVDHGENREPGDAATEQGWEKYQQLLAAQKLKRLIAKPGDVLPLTGIQVRVVSADGALIEHALAGGGEANPNCDASEKRAADHTENARSLGTLITFGKLRILDLGDLTWDKERDLVCPVNKLGKMDIFVVSHHGLNQSNSPALVYGIAPRVAIMDNGATKGGSAPSWDIIEKSPGLEDLWQLHFAEAGGEAHNAAQPFLANLPGPDAGNYLKVTAWTDGSFEVFNSRTDKTRHYAAGH